ncbi:MAG: ABC transporter ATP-binding protein [Muribaculaceae bacterium]|nr:ABC transporter ATP-binding protein [Muribaculaceae bacterium]
MLDIENLVYRYRRKGPPVLDGFSLRLESGGIYGLLGPNGAGKSTLLYLITGALTPLEGRVTLNGTDTRRRLPATLSDIYIVGEETLMPRMRLSEYVRHTAPFYPRFRREVMDKCLETFGMTADVRMNNLSMGQKKKIALSFALACDTPVLLMDEPTNGLDIPAKAAFRSLCAELMTDERIIIISTHQVRDLDQLLDHVLMMNDRRLVLDRTVAELQSKLSFARGVSREVAENSLAYIRTPGGYDVMNPATAGEEESELNLELLFNTTLSDPERINKLLNP